MSALFVFGTSDSFDNALGSIATDTSQLQNSERGIHLVRSFLFQGKALSVSISVSAKRALFRGKRQDRKRSRRSAALSPREKRAGGRHRLSVILANGAAMGPRTENWLETAFRAPSEPPRR